MGRLFLLPISLLAFALAAKIASLPSKLSLAPQPEFGGVWVAVATILVLSGWLDNPPSPHQRGTGLYRTLPEPGLLGLTLLILGVSLVVRWPIGVFGVGTVGALAVFYRQATQPAWARPDTVNGWLGLGAAPRWPAYALVLLPAWAMQAWLAARFGDPHPFLDDFASPERVLFFAFHFGLVLAAPLVLQSADGRRRFTAGVLLDALLLGIVISLARRFTWPAPFNDPTDGRIAFHAVWALRGAAAFGDRWPRAKLLWVMWAFAVMVTCLLIKVTGMKDTVLGLAVFAAVEGALSKWSHAPVKRVAWAVLTGACVAALVSWVR